MTWVAIAVLAAGTYAMKAVGPVVVGRRAFPEWARRLLSLVAVSLLAAVIALSTLTVADRVRIDGPLTAGVAVAALAVWRRAPFAVVVVAAAATAALLRAVT